MRTWRIAIASSISIKLSFGINWYISELPRRILRKLSDAENFDRWNTKPSHCSVSLVIELFGTRFTQVLLNHTAILSLRFTVFYNFLTLAIWAVDRLTLNATLILTVIPLETSTLRGVFQISLSSNKSITLPIIDQTLWICPINLGQNNTSKTLPFRGWSVHSHQNRINLTIPIEYLTFPVKSQKACWERIVDKAQHIRYIN